jgi:hypothetical protein
MRRPAVGAVSNTNNDRRRVSNLLQEHEEEKEEEKEKKEEKEEEKEETEEKEEKEEEKEEKEEEVEHLPNSKPFPRSAHTIAWYGMR